MLELLSCRGAANVHIDGCCCSLVLRFSRAEQVKVQWCRGAGSYARCSKGAEVQIWRC
jgi:hypothetical protein